VSIVIRLIEWRAIARQILVLALQRIGPLLKPSMFFALRFRHGASIAAGRESRANVEDLGV
jgi:hypothetical protein